ncbi:unnamed protein product [Lactuca virosa]|uniref:Ubiquitin-like protease family profile domain-containing protein n=1 Tax=Lactuca virosa TaxID=75947 RepID=A0AAU9NJW7_9ASTR|nr:unnamed protein product [Lactuca virosa]
MSNGFTQIRQQLTLMRAIVPCVMDKFVDGDEFIDKMEGDEKKHADEEAKSTHTVVQNKEDEKEAYIKVAMFKGVDKKVVGIHDGSNDECGNNKDDKVDIFEDVEKKKDRSIVDKGPMYKIPKNMDHNKHKKRPRAYFKSSYMSIPSTSREPLRPPHFKIDALQSEEIFALYDKRDEEALSFTYRGEYVGYPWGIDFWKHIFCHNDPIEERGWLETSHIDMWSLLLLDTKLPEERWTIMPIHFMAFFDKKSLIPFANGSKPPYVDWANVDLVLFPININNCHWLTGGMDLRTWTLTLYDSSISEVSNEIILENLLAFKENFNDFLKLIDYWTNTGRESTHMNLNIQFAKGVPQQVNGSDCGVFVCMWLEALSSGKELNIKTDDVAAECMEYRRRMARIIWARRD